MKKILSLLIITLLAFIAFTPEVNALENPTYWVLKENGYYEYTQSSSDYKITRDDFSNYRFEYKINNDNWRVFALNNGDVLENNVKVGNNYVTRTILINGVELVSGTAGLTGPDNKSIYMRYKQIDGFETPTEPLLENFVGASLTSSYSDGNFVGINGISWTYKQAREAGDYSIDGTGIMLRRANDSYIEAVFPNGIDSLSFNYRKAETNINERQLEVLIDGIEIETTDIFGTEQMAEETVYNLTIEVNKVGPVIVRIKNVGETSTNRQTTISNFSWTNYTGVPTSSDWVENDGYMVRLFDSGFAFNTDTIIDIENINNKIIEYRIYDQTEDTYTNYRIINVSEQSRLIIRNKAQGYSSVSTLIIQDGATERAITTTTVNPSIITLIEIRYIEIDSANTSTVNDLPLTRGSIFDNEMDMGSVKFIVNGLRLQTIISYDGITYFLDNTFIANTDMNLFRKGVEIYYYTHDDQKFILINEDNQSIFTGNIKTQTFVPYTIWNLSTNELEHINRFTTYMYSKMEAGNNAYAYFYVDEFIIDELLSVSLAYKYRYIKSFGGYSDYEEKYMILEAGATTNVDTATWQAKAMMTTVAATTVALQIPFVRWPALLIGTAAVLFIDSTIDNGYFGLGNIEQIKEATIDNKLKNEMTQAFSTASKPFALDPSLKVFKLHLGQFNKAFTSGIEIDSDFSVLNGQKGINIIEFTYRTDGRLYTVKGENIKITFEAGEGTDGKKPQPSFDLWQIIKDLFKNYPLAAWSIVGVLSLLIVLPIVTKIKKNIKRFIR